MVKHAPPYEEENKRGISLVGMGYLLCWLGYTPNQMVRIRDPPLSLPVLSPGTLSSTIWCFATARSSIRKTTLLRNVT